MTGQAIENTRVFTPSHHARAASMGIIYSLLTVPLVCITFISAQPYLTGRFRLQQSLPLTQADATSRPVNSQCAPWPVN
jgi:hypothetical protein